MLSEISHVWTLQPHYIINVYSLVLLWLYAGDPQEDAGCGQHARALQHGDETHRKTSHSGQVHHDRRHAAHLCLHVPGNQISGLTCRTSTGGLCF